MLSGRLPTGAEVLTFFQHDKGVEVANHVTKGRIKYPPWFSNTSTDEDRESAGEEELMENLRVDFAIFTGNGSVIYMDKEKIDTAEIYITKIRGLNNE